MRTPKFLHWYPWRDERWTSRWIVGRIAGSQTGIASLVIGSSRRIAAAFRRDRERLIACLQKDAYRYCSFISSKGPPPAHFRKDVRCQEVKTLAANRMLPEFPFSFLPFRTFRVVFQAFQISQVFQGDASFYSLN